MQLSGKKLEYLLYLYQCKEPVTQSRLAERFSVSLVTAHRTIGAMEELGLVQKATHGHSISLTREGREQAQQWIDCLNDLFLWMRDELGLSEGLAQTESLKMVGSQDRGLLRRINAQTKLRRAMLACGEKGRQCTDLAGLEKGVYPLSFITLKKDGVSQSMGDRAFLKPAELAIEEGEGAILLRSREIKHRSLVGKIMRGSLKRLWYRQEEQWLPACRREEGQWVVPLGAVEVLRESKGAYGLLCIRAEPTCNFPRMSEHSAYLKFDLAYLPLDGAPGSHCANGRKIDAIAQEVSVS